MLKRQLPIALVVMALQLAFAPTSTAQCTMHWQTEIWYLGDPSLPPGTVCGPGQGPYSLMCSVPTTQCPVPMVWCPTCGKYIPVAAQPINLTNGNTYIQELDVRVPGLGNGITLQRTWNSMWPSDSASYQSGMFGSGWRSTYEERLFTGNGNTTGYMVYLREDGGLWYFSKSGDSTWSVASPASSTATLTNNNNQTWTLLFQNGEQRVFSYASGSLTAISDRNGNTKQLSYDGQNRLTTLTDPASRHLYFNYQNGSSSLVSSVTSDFGITLSYSYDTQGRLLQVTRPDQSTLSFTYNNQSLITAVTDSQGKTLESHSYDGQGRGISASRANGVEAVSVSYPNE